MSAPRTGVNVVGWFSAQPGMGPVAAAYADALEAAGVPVFRADLSAARSVDGAHPITLVCMTARALAGLTLGSRRRPWPGEYVIGCWPWELAEPDPMMRIAARFVDEVWAPSTFAAAAVRAAGVEQVHVIPHVIQPRSVAAPPAADQRRSRAELGIPPGRLFLSIVNLGSSTNEPAVLARKNPVAFIDAYRQAFTASSGTACCLKTVGGDEAPQTLEQLQKLTRDRADCVVVDRRLSAPEMNALFAHASAYVSLHRGEGFGLAVAEAMAAGLPVLATDYSGTTDFLSAETGFPVNYRLAPVGSGNDPYPSEALWADPDLAHAAQLMRDVLASPQTAATRADHGRRLIAGRFAPAPVAALINARLEALTR